MPGPSRRYIKSKWGCCIFFGLNLLQDTCSTTCKWSLNHFHILLYAIRIMLKSEVSMFVYIYTESVRLFIFCHHTLKLYINRLTPCRTKVFVEKMSRFCEGTYYINQKLKWPLTSVLMGRLHSSSGGTCLISLYIILASFVKIKSELCKIWEF